MYTYFISGVITIIALLCIFKKSRQNADIKMLMLIIFFVLNVIVTSVVNVVRYDTLATIVEVDETIKLYPVVIKTDSTWVTTDSTKTWVYTTVDSVLTDSTLSYKHNENVFTEKPDSTIKSVLRIKEHHSMIYFNLKDSALYISTEKDGTKRKIYKSTIIKSSNKNLYIYYDENYVADNWTSSFALPVKREWVEICINSEILDSLISTHPIIEEQWTIQR